jgi:hypothetical protein
MILIMLYVGEQARRLGHREIPPYPPWRGGGDGPGAAVEGGHTGPPLRRGAQAQLGRVNGLPKCNLGTRSKTRNPEPASGGRGGSPYHGGGSTGETPVPPEIPPNPPLQRGEMRTAGGDARATGFSLIPGP